MSLPIQPRPHPAVFELRLLGDAVLLNSQGERLQPWRPQLAMLAFLALAPGYAVSRTVLAGTLWPETTESRARRTLRQTLFRLRRDIGEVVVAECDHVRLDATVCVIDVARFEEHLAAGSSGEAVSLYGGDFLGDFRMGSQLFDLWADGERARLRLGVARAFEVLSGEAEAEGRWRDALASVEQWLRTEPYSEVAAARLITLRAHLGDRSGALSFFEEFQKRLRGELDVSPGAELLGLVRRVERAGASLLPPVEPFRGAGRGVRTDAPMVGRVLEFQRIQRRWQRARNGVPQLVLLTGEAGIGKTRLVQELTTWARSNGATVLSGRAYEIEQGVPYTSLAQLLRASLNAPGLGGVDSGSLAALGEIVPEFITRFSGGVTLAPQPDQEIGRVRLLEAFRTLIDALAYEQPIVLTMDDLPWADAATLAALHYLWRGLGDTPLLLLATARRSSVVDDQAMHRLLAPIARNFPEQLESIAVQPLTASSIAKLIDGLGGLTPEDPDRRTLAAALERETGGNPLFLVEALRSRAEGIPLRESDTVRMVIEERLNRLSSSARELLRAAAVLGRRFPLPVAAALVGQSRSESLNSLDELLDRGLLRVTGYEYDFVHDLMRETVYAGMSAERRRALHRSALERLLPGDAAEEVGMERTGNLALHATESGSAPEAYHWLCHAADLAWARFAGDAAEGFLEQALEFAGSDRERRGVTERLADLKFTRSRFRDAAVTYRQVLDWTARARSADRLRLRVKLLDSVLRSGIADLAAAEDATAALLTDARRMGGSLLRDALGVVASAHLRAGRVDEAEALATQALEVAGWTPEEGAPLVRMLLLRAQIANLRQPAEDVLTYLDRAGELARMHGMGRELCDVESDRGTELYRQQRWNEARAVWESVIEHGQEIGAIGAVAVAHVNFSDLLVRRQQVDAANRHLDQAEELATRHRFHHVLVDCAINRALLGWLRRDVDGVLSHTTVAIQRAEEHGIIAGKRVASALRTLALLDVGRIQEAAQALEESVLVTATRAHPTWGDDREFIALARARFARVGGDAAGAARLLEEAIRDAADPYATALLRVELAVCLGGSDPVRSRELARLAGETAARLGTPLLEPNVAAPSGEPPPIETPISLPGSTPTPGQPSRLQWTG